jgi:hypothetical protein
VQPKVNNYLNQAGKIDMDIYSEINNLRDCGFVNCGIVDKSMTLKKLALRFELSF